MDFYKPTFNNYIMMNKEKITYNIYRRISPLKEEDIYVKYITDYSLYKCTKDLPKEEFVKIGIITEATVEDYQKNIDQKFTDKDYILNNIDRFVTFNRMRVEVFEKEKIVYKDKESFLVTFWNKLFKRKLVETFTWSDLTGNN